MGLREAFGVRRIPALSIRAVRNSHTAPEYGALQTLRANAPGFDLGYGRRAQDPSRLPPAGTNPLRWH